MFLVFGTFGFFRAIVTYIQVEIYLKTNERNIYYTANHNEKSYYQATIYTLYPK